MRTLNLAIITILWLALSACSGGGSGGTSSGGSVTPPVTDDSQPSAFKVIGMDRHQVSSFGSTVTMQLNAAPPAITSVRAGSVECLFTHIGQAIVASIPEELSGTIQLTVRDDLGRALQFEVQNELQVQQGLTISVNRLPFTDHPTSLLDGANNRILINAESPWRLEWFDLDTHQTSSYPVPLTNASQYYVNGQHYQYRNESGQNVMRRYDPVTGELDLNFIGVAQNNGIIGSSADHLYFVDIVTIASINRVANLKRHNISDGSLDTAFADNGVYRIEDFIPTGDPNSAYSYDHTLHVMQVKVREYQDKVYVYIDGAWAETVSNPPHVTLRNKGPHLRILNRADGSEVSVPDLFRGPPLYLTDAHQSNGFNHTHTQIYRSTMDFRVDGTGIFLFGGHAGTQRVRHQDFLLDDAFYVNPDTVALNATTDWRDVDHQVYDSKLKRRTMGVHIGHFAVNSGAAKNHPNIGWEPLLSGRNLIDVTPLDSGNYMLIQIEEDSRIGTVRQICGYVIQPDGQPIRGHRNQKSCTAIEFDRDAVGGVPIVQIIPDISGEKFYRSGNRYTYIFQTGGVTGGTYRVDFDIIE